jgi:hypothetical protein
MSYSAELFRHPVPRNKIFWLALNRSAGWTRLRLRGCGKRIQAKGRYAMFRKTMLALAIGAAALIPTVASAKGPHGHHGGFFRGGFGITVIDRSYDDSCGWQLVKVGRNLYKRQWVCN